MIHARGATGHRLHRLAGQRVRSAEAAVEMTEGRPGRAISVQYVDVQERWNVGTAATGSPRTGPRRTGADARSTGPPRRDCRSQYSVCRPRRPMGTVGGCRATDRASRLGRQKCSRISPPGLGIE